MSDAKLIRQYSELVRAGHTLKINRELLQSETLTDLDLLLDVCKLSGGSIAEVLDRFAKVLLSREQTFSELQISVAGPKASARLIMALPALVLLSSAIAGLPIFNVFFTSGLALTSVCIGLVFYLVGARWTNRILKNATPDYFDPGIKLDALAIYVSAGESIGSACAQLGIDFEFDSSAGIASRQIILERADALRQDKSTADRNRIAKASVAILWPLGLAILPAFVFVALVPTAIAIYVHH